MKRKLLIVSFVLLGTTLFAQQPEHPDNGFTNKVEAKNLIIKGKKEGKWVEYTRNVMGTYGEKEEVEEHDINKADNYYLAVYKNDSLNGPERSYNKNEKLLSIVFYRNGLKDGVARQYFSDGEHDETPFKNDTIEGIETGYFANGKISAETPYTKGEENGIMKTYDSTGRIYKEIPFTKGNEDGIEKEYRDNGKLATETLYKEGLIKWYKEFDENGNEIK